MDLWENIDAAGFHRNEVSTSLFTAIKNPVTTYVHILFIVTFFLSSLEYLRSTKLFGIVLYKHKIQAYKPLNIVSDLFKLYIKRAQHLFPQMLKSITITLWCWLAKYLKLQNRLHNSNWIPRLQLGCQICLDSLRPQLNEPR